MQDILGTTDDYPETLNVTISNIELSLPFPSPDGPSTLQNVQEVVEAQENLVRAMASVLENLANHYDGMATALKESENGEVFSGEELQGRYVLSPSHKESLTVKLSYESRHRRIVKHHV